MDRTQRQTLGLYFKTLAGRRALKQRDIARALELDRSMISRLFGGSIQSDDPYERLAGYFEMSLEEANTSARVLAEALGPDPGAEADEQPAPSRGYVITVASEKGGVGKTTLSVNLGASLSARGLEVLVVDLDPQGNTTQHLGVDDDGEVLAHLLRGLSEVGSMELVETDFGFDLIAGGRSLATARAELLTSGTGIGRVDQLIDPLRDLYDVIILDTPPAAGILQQSAIVACDGVLTPIILEGFAIEGLETLLDTIEQVRPYNPDVEYLGCVVTILDTRKRSQRKILRHLERHEDARLIDVRVRTDARVNDAQILNVPVRVHDASAKAARDYDRLAHHFEEVITDGTH